MFQIKICGITELDDALAAIDAGADAIGLNFFPGSPRYIDPDRARALVQKLPPGVVKVGVFVNESYRRMLLIKLAVGLDAIQLHGDEPPQVFAPWSHLPPVVKAFRGLEQGLVTLVRYIGDCDREARRDQLPNDQSSRAGESTPALVRSPALVLLDAVAPAGQFGGSGRVVDWRAAAKYRELSNMPRLILAGGLKPENVAEAIRVVRPYGVDTASGVESSPGRKDHGKVRAFVTVSRETLTAIETAP